MLSAEGLITMQRVTLDGTKIHGCPQNFEVSRDYTMNHKDLRSAHHFRFMRAGLWARRVRPCFGNLQPSMIG